MSVYIVLCCVCVCVLVNTTSQDLQFLVMMLQLPGADAGKPDVGGAAKDAAKKTPFGFMNVGDLAFDLPGSNVSKDDLPNNVKPGDAAGLPKGPTAKPPSGPSLPKVRHTAVAKNRHSTGASALLLPTLHVREKWSVLCTGGFLP